MKKRLLSTLLVLCMVLTLCTGTAWAADSGQGAHAATLSISHRWDQDFDLPTAAEIASCQTSLRAPYIASWLKIDSGTRYDAYSVDVKADYLPYGTYVSPANFYLDLSSLEKEYVSVSRNGHLSGYAGLQRSAPGKYGGEGYASILSFWDIYCTDASGKTTTIRAERTYSMEGAGGESFSGEGTGAHTQLPYDWKAGRWYRMVLLCGTSEETGNTTVEQWFMDLATEEWTHTCTYDTGIKDSCFIGNMAFFLENFLPAYAGELRSMEVTNIRIRTISDGQWHGVTSTGNFTSQNSQGLFGPGSWQAGADANSFYIITTGVEGKGTGVNSATLTIRNPESGDPFAQEQEQPTVFTDVPDWCAKAASWAAAEGIAKGTGGGLFSPDTDCTNAQILTFLWRAAGEPSTSVKAPFTVASYYQDAVNWAYDQGMITNSSNPDAICTRADAMVFIWQAFGSPSVTGSSGFSDVSANANYAESVSWAVANGIAAGTGDGKFSPSNTCARGQIITFLYRAYA